MRPVNSERGCIQSWRSKLVFLFGLGCLFISVSATAQSDIPLGTWRLHTSYNAIHSIALQGDKKVFGAAEHGILVLDRSENALTSYTKLSGLSGSTITAIQFDESTGLLIVAYADGRFDVINAELEISSFDPARDAGLTGSRTINHIFLQNSIAYLSAGYGVIVFDLTRLQVKETWRDLGASGTTLSVLQCTILGDSVFLATAAGVLAGDQRTNLLDFNKWKRFNTGEFASAIQSITSFNGTLYAAVNNSGLHRYANGSWIKQDFLQDTPIRSINGTTNSMLIAGEEKLWKLLPSDLLLEVTAAYISTPYFATADSGGKLWIGDGKNGLVSDASGSFDRYLPNSPSTDKIVNLEVQNGTLYALAGGYNAALVALGNDGNTDAFENGNWTTETLPVADITDRAYRESPNKVYSASFGSGVVAKDDQGVTIYDETNSPLLNTNPPGRFVNIPSLVNSDDGLWVANYDVSKPLHLLKADNTWESFSFPFASSRYPLQLNIDRNSWIWMILNPDQGGGILVFDKTGNTTAYLTDAPGSGGLPSKSVRTMAVDRDGLVWVGTDLGVAYFISGESIFTSGTDAIKPIVDGRFLLRDDKVTAIAVDGGNRKWIGTARGVWLFNSTGEELIYNFTTENSPLVSNVIRDIEINGITGEVFFATAEGLVSFRGDATESNFRFQDVKVFPNPVTGGFSGNVGISGLATDAIVKITDISGKLVWETQANGGTATWNVHDYAGKRVPTGIYIVFTVTPDGAEHVSSKIAVVD